MMRMVTATCRSFSPVEISSCTVQELFAGENLSLHSAGAFRAWKFFAARCRSFSRTEISSCTVQELFAHGNSSSQRAAGIRQKFKRKTV